MKVMRLALEPDSVILKPVLPEYALTILLSPFQGKPGIYAVSKTGLNE